MMTIRVAIAAFVVAGLAGSPFAAQAKKHRPVRHHHYTSVVQTGTYPTTAGVTMPRTVPPGSSGPAIGTVTAPSVGSYYWPSVGVTNAVPTWRNTNPR
jgi:hypothetical protein